MKRKIEEKLKTWKNKGNKRMPLILNGARQVGKTYILREFGEKYYENVAYINLETNLEVSSYFAENIAPDKILKYLEITIGEKILPGNTLIIFDEIQSCERALTALKYFYEETPEYHIVCAGSLLGVAINRNKYSFPVGKVETLSLYPLDFEEFLWANNQTLLSEEIKSSYQKMEPLPDGLHKLALEYYRYYLIIGGMPAAINTYLNENSLIDVSNIQNEILNNYIADMAKYATPSDSVKIRACFNSIPAQLAKENKKFQYKVVQKGGSSTIFGASIEWLLQSSVLLKCQKIEQGIEPLSIYSDLSSFKLYMGDVGLLVVKSGLSGQTILSDTDNTFMGAVTENYVAQQLIANNHILYYWESKGIAELDFVIQLGNQIIAIEVKKGIRTKSKSLNLFIEKFKPDRSIRISSKNFGMSDHIISIPLYAVFCISK
jgi:hypothetical protein